MQLTANQVIALKNGKTKYTWFLREIFKVTQWKEGCVYRTKSIGFVIAQDITVPHGYIVCPLSTSESRKLL